MIKNNELKIGNYISVDGKFIEVLALKENLFAFKVYSDNRMISSWNPYIPINRTGVKGIVVTPDILIGIGFEQRSETYFTYESISVNLGDYPNICCDWVSEHDEVFNYEILYLHTLQNVYSEFMNHERKLNIKF